MLYIEKKQKGKSQKLNINENCNAYYRHRMCLLDPRTTNKYHVHLRF